MNIDHFFLLACMTWSATSYFLLVLNQLNNRFYKLYFFLRIEGGKLGSSLVSITGSAL